MEKDPKDRKLDPANYMREHGIDEYHRMKCPNCKRVFIAGTGRAFLCEYTLETGEKKIGEVLFCSFSCILTILNPDDMLGPQ